MGGTFDPFHIGHEALLQKAIDISQKILIGLTTDKRATATRPNYHVAPMNIEKADLSLGYNLKTYLTKWKLSLWRTIGDQQLLERTLKE